MPNLTSHISPFQLRHWVLWGASLTVNLGAIYLVATSIQGQDEIEFGRVWALWGCVVGVVVAGRGFHVNVNAMPSFWYSRTRSVGEIPKGLVGRFSRVPVLVRSIALILIAIALARPQTMKEEVRVAEGVDLFFVLDISKSMEESDLKRNRLDAGQRTIREFLRKRRDKGDRIGLVVFAQEAMLQCPLTLDYKSLETIVAGLEIGDVPSLGTAIGDALGLALASFRRSKGASKVVILLSDGDWNKARYMDPTEARELSVEMGVRVFTVLLGQEGTSSKQTTSAGRRQYAVNPTVLKDMADSTGGLYFNAQDNWALSHSFDEIRRTLALDETNVIGRVPNAQLFWLFLVPAFLLLLFEVWLRMTRFRRFV